MSTVKEIAVPVTKPIQEPMFEEQALFTALENLHLALRAVCNSNLPYGDQLETKVYQMIPIINRHIKRLKKQGCK